MHNQLRSTIESQLLELQNASPYDFLTISDLRGRTVATISTSGKMSANLTSLARMAARQETEELVWGYHLNRVQLLKAGFTYSYRHAGYWGEDYWPAEKSFGAEFQLVTSLNTISEAFH